MRSLLPDFVAVAALTVVAFGAGRFAAGHTLNPPDLYYLSPAVQVATGHGLRDMVVAPDSALADFLSRRTATLAVADASPLSTVPPDAFQSATRYLIYAVGYWWRVDGISWSGVAGVAATLHVAAVLGFYACVRLFAASWIAGLTAGWLAVSTLQLALVPHLRDYSKASFILAALPCVLLVAFHDVRWRTVWIACAVAGAVIGVGFGFRMDVAVMLPLAFAAVMIRGRRPWSDLREKAIAVAVLIAATAIPAWPVVSQLSRGGSNDSHVALLGHASQFNSGLGVTPSIYALVPFYSDAYVGTMVGGYAAPGGTPMAVPSPEYAAASRELWFRLISTFPADVYARLLAAAHVVLNLPFRAPDPSFDEPLPLQWSLLRVNRALTFLDGAGVVVVWATVALAATGGITPAIFACVVVLVLAGYPSLQFSDRHFFFLQAIPLLSIAILISTAMRIAMTRVGRAADRSVWNWTRVLKPLAIATVLLLATTWLPLASLRAYQSPRVAELLETYGERHRVPLQTEVVPEGNDTFLVKWPTSEGLDHGTVANAQYVLEFTAESATEPIAAGIRYRSNAAETDFSRVLFMRARPGANLLIFAAPTIGGTSAVEGVELGARALKRLTGVFRVDTGRGRRLPLDAALPAGWRGQTLYQSIGHTADSTGLDSVVCSPEPSCRGLLGYLDRAESLPRLDHNVLGFHSEITIATADGIIVDGSAESDSSYFFQLEELTALAPGAFVARGTLHEGSAAIGVLKDGRWHQQALLSRHGAFTFIAPLAAGAYVPLATNAPTIGPRKSRMSLTHGGFLEAAR